MPVFKTPLKLTFEEVLPFLKWIEPFPMEGINSSLFT